MVASPCLREREKTGRKVILDDDDDDDDKEERNEPAGRGGFQHGLPFASPSRGDS